VSTPDDFEVDDEDLVEDEDDEAEDGDLTIVEDLDELTDLGSLDEAEAEAEAEVVPAITLDDDDDDDDDETVVDLDEEVEEVVDAEAEESLDVLLAREKVSDDDDLGRLEEPRDVLTLPAPPIGAEEFTCSSCFLVKNRAQLADDDKLICFDCA